MSRERASRRFYRVDSTNYLFEFMDRGYTAQHENRWNFEVAWEAANKGMICIIYVYINLIREYIILTYFYLFFY